MPQGESAKLCKNPPRGFKDASTMQKNSDFSNPRFFEIPDKSNQNELPLSPITRQTRFGLFKFFSVLFKINVLVKIILKGGKIIVLLTVYGRKPHILIVAV